MSCFFVWWNSKQIFASDNSEGTHPGSVGTKCVLSLIRDSPLVTEWCIDAWSPTTQTAHKWHCSHLQWSFSKSSNWQHVLCCSSLASFCMEQLMPMFESKDSGKLVKTHVNKSSSKTDKCLPFDKKGMFIFRLQRIVKCCSSAFEMMMALFFCFCWSILAVPARC